MLVPSLDAVARGGTLAYRIHPIGADLQKMRRGSEAVERLMRVNGAEWDDEMIAQLRTLWSEGLSAAEIGRRVGVSKNAVIGKARRLFLERRKSPINFSGVVQPPRWRAVPKPPKATLPPMRAPSVAPVFRLQPRQIAAFGRRPPEPPPPSIAIPRYSPTDTCQWTDSVGRPWVFCDAPSLFSRSYCPTHYRRVYHCVAVDAA